MGASPSKGYVKVFLALIVVVSLTATGFTGNRLWQSQWFERRSPHFHDCGVPVYHEASGQYRTLDCAYVKSDRCFKKNRHHHPDELTGDPQDLASGRSLKFMISLIANISWRRTQPSEERYGHECTAPIVTDYYHQKILHRMVVGRRSPDFEIYQILQDKILAKQWALIKGDIPAAKVLFISDSCNDLPPIKDLPSDFVYKSSHLSGCILVIRNGTVIQEKGCPMCNTSETFYPTWDGPKPLEGTHIDDRHLKASCNAWISTDYKNEDYAGISPRVFIEDILPGNIVDVKCLTFHGRVAYYYLSLPHHRYAIFARNGSHVDVSLLGDPIVMDFRLTQSMHNTVIEKCEKLGEGFDHVRVDLFADVDNQKLFFAEMTFYPYGGIIVFPLDFDRHLAHDFWGCNYPGNIPSKPGRMRCIWNYTNTPLPSAYHDLRTVISMTCPSEAPLCMGFRNNTRYGECFAVDENIPHDNNINRNMFDPPFYYLT